jgi:hypothetical protein
MRLIAPIGKEWINGSILRVKFLEGSADQQGEVLSKIKNWENTCNIKFRVVEDGPSDIRITFNPDDGSWSYIGTDCRHIDQSQPTMNLGWLDGGVIEHEFGHALGFSHEHQNPSGGIEWNEQQVIKDLSGPPNFWDELTVRHNVLSKYSYDQIRGTIFDPLSIMCYSFPSNWTKNGITIRENDKLSLEDKKFALLMYPKQSNPSINIKVGGWFRTYAAFEQLGEEDLFVFDVTAIGYYRANIISKMDTAIKLYGPDDPKLLVAEDDNSGVRKNGQVIKELGPGKYWIQVRSNDIGTYSVKVNRL